uniref:Ootheca protein n=1 Tax=Pseudomantis albofimbriata TaxID=627833 RepID=I3PM78_9NEOP|nr:ootheca protein [Pseudomantis albofimbriata]
MAGLVKFGLLLILGVLQVSAGEYKDIQLGNIACEVKCFEKTSALTEGNQRSERIMKSDSEIKVKLIQAVEGVISAAEQCCGKESEEKKCLEEVVYPALLKIIDPLSIFFHVNVGLFTQTLANLSLVATYAQRELDCCCKLEDCVQKIEFPTASYKGGIKECKGEYCVRNLNQLLAKLRDYLPAMVTSKLLEDRLISSYFNFQKYKEQVPKEGKCKEEKGLAELNKEINSFNLLVKYYSSYQVALNSFDEEILSLTSAAAIEILGCASEKDIKQYIPCN